MTHCATIALPCQHVNPQSILDCHWSARLGLQFIGFEGFGKGLQKHKPALQLAYT